MIPSVTRELDAPGLNPAKGDGSAMKGPNTINDGIRALRESYGSDLLILGHHYQRDSVLTHADERGDSLELARKAASRRDAKRIVFCGVRFMAESADILTTPKQAVYMPAPQAGCPMARMADVEAMRQAWASLNRLASDWLPVVYVNSTAGIKACCGEWGGSACTSSNAGRVFEWVLKQNKKVFFLPDEHLGVNTAHDLGLNSTDVALYDPRLPDGGLTAETADQSRVVVWKGFCLVHAAFTVDAVHRVRRLRPAAKIIVHPETPRAVVELADAHGSTSQIIDYVKKAAPGSEIVIGTEQNLVQRLADEERGRLTIKSLAGVICANMAKTHAASLLTLLQDWPESHRVTVPEATATPARRALETMLSL